ncbi:MAG: hydroxymethylbilane synthase, partial [Chthonomonadales bacterium]
MEIFRIGTRGSLLARTQTEWVADRIRNLNPNLKVEIIIIRTTGDANQTSPFAQVGTKGMFVKELEEALLACEIDCAVHSLKDMPSDLPDGLMLAAIPDREDPRDAYLSNSGPLMELKPGSVMGTSSPRRRAQLLNIRPDLRVEELRGNLDTRIRKLDEGQYDGILVACAGLERLGLANRITERLDGVDFTPAPGQGALALEVRTNDSASKLIIEPMANSKAVAETTCERSFQQTLAGGCGVPAGCLARVKPDGFKVFGMIANDDGSNVRREY